MPAFLAARAGLQRANGGPTRFGIGSNRNKSADGLGAQQSQMTRVTRWTGAGGLRDPVLRVPWWYVTSTDVETNVGNGGTVSASIEYPAGTFRQALLAGSPVMTVADGTAPDFDPMAGLSIPPYTRFVVHCRADGGAGGKTPVNAFLSTSRFGDGLDLGATGTVADKTMTGGEGAQSAVGLRGYTPWVLGTVAAGARDAIVWGDSIANGDVENADAAGGDAFGGFSFIERILNLNGFAYVNMARSATKAAQWQAAGALAKRLDALRGLTGANRVKLGLNELAHNDWSATVAAWTGYMGTLNAALAAYAQRIVNCTTTPYAASSSDGYTTQAGQTPQGGSNLGGFNAAVRALALPGQSGCLDIAQAVANPANPAYWRTPGDTGYTPVPTQAVTLDGTHCVTYGCQYATALIDATALL